MRYAKFERLVLLVITLAVVIMAISMVVQRTDGVEVFGHLLMLAVIVCSLYGGKRGALLGFLACLAAYIAVRLLWLGDCSAGTAVQLILVKLAVYGALALLCHHMRAQFRYFFVKMERQDLVDDETQLGNARFLLQELTDRINEYERYEKPFSLVCFAVDDGFVSAMKARRVSVLRDLATNVLKSDTRAVDELVREGNRLFAILPNVGMEGAQACARRLSEKARSYLSQAGEGDGDKSLEVSVLAYPEAREEIDGLLARLRESEGPAA
jgi:hypothetical protein